MSLHSLAHHFLTEAYQNAWANHRLLRACCELSHEEFIAPRTGFFPSIKATLNHNLTVDWYYLEIMQRSLAHVFEHQIHHRGQVHAMLAETGVEPPQLDEFYCTGEDVLRAKDFAELCFNEKHIWGDRALPP